MNPNSEKPGSTTALVVHPEVVSAITGTLLKWGRKRSQLEDDVPEVQTRALEAAKRGMPADVGAWKALCATIAVRFVRDEREKASTAKKYDEGLCEEPDASGPIEQETDHDPVDRQRYLVILDDLFQEGRMPEMGMEILFAVADEAPFAEIAGETALTEPQVIYRLKIMRQAFRKRLRSLGLLAVPVFLRRPANDPLGRAREHEREHEPDRATKVLRLLIEDA